MLDAFEFEFMRRALLAGVLVGWLAGYFGVFIVQRRLSFLGSGLSHAAFGGVALGVLLGVEPLWVAAPFTAATAAAMVWVERRTRLAGDTAVGILSAVAMALGVVFLSLRRDYSQDAFAYLFGSILAVRASDLWITAAVVALSVFTWRAWGRWAYATFDRELAEADRVPAGRDDYLLAICVSVAIVVSVKLVGIVLLAAFLVIPPASARLVSRTFSGMTVASMALATTSVFCGLLVAWRLDLPGGATIILLQAGAFGAAYLVRYR